MQLHSTTSLLQVRSCREGIIRLIYWDSNEGVATSFHNLSNGARQAALTCPDSETVKVKWKQWTWKYSMQQYAACNIRQPTVINEKFIPHQSPKTIEKALPHTSWTDDLQLPHHRWIWWCCTTHARWVLSCSDRTAGSRWTIESPVSQSNQLKWNYKKTCLACLCRLCLWFDWIFDDASVINPVACSNGHPMVKDRFNSRCCHPKQSCGRYQHVDLGIRSPQFRYQTTVTGNQQWRAFFTAGCSHETGVRSTTSAVVWASANTSSLGSPRCHQTFNTRLHTASSPRCTIVDLKITSWKTTS